MRIGIHQPMYLPWLGLFDRIQQCDLFIVLDNVAYSKNYFLNRNKIKTAHGWTWLTIPVLTKGNSSQMINDVEIDNKTDWRKKHWMSLYYSYKNASFFNNYQDFLASYFEQEWIHLVDASTAMLSYLITVLNIKTEIKMASSLEVQGQKEDLILNVCKFCQAEEYLSGPDGRNYLTPELWERHHINVRFHDYRHPQYPQLYGDFISHLSVIDLLCNCGPRSLEILTN